MPKQFIAQSTSCHFLGAADPPLKKTASGELAENPVNEMVRRLITTLQ
jgi:hypothetical protein